MDQPSETIVKFAVVNSRRIGTVFVLGTLTWSCRDMGPDIPVYITVARSNVTYPSPPPLIQPTAGGISVTAGYWKGVCSELVATARRDGDLIEMSVFQKGLKLPANVSCPDLLASFNYVATLAGLGRGTFHVRVEQTGEASGRNGLVADETVVVQ